MKLILVVIVVLGCRGPWKSPLRPPNVRGLLAAVKPKLTVDVDAAALVAAQQQQQQQQQPPPEPRSAEPPARHVDRTPAPEPIVRRTVAPPPTYVLRGETMAGQKICTKWTSMEECNADCTRQIRAAAMAALEHDAGATKSCVCVEAKGC
jgi:hypothetical protein